MSISDEKVLNFLKALDELVSATESIEETRDIVLKVAEESDYGASLVEEFCSWFK